MLKRRTGLMKLSKAVLVTAFCGIISFMPVYAAGPSADTEIVNLKKGPTGPGAEIPAQPQAEVQQPEAEAQQESAQQPQPEGQQSQEQQSQSAGEQPLPELGTAPEQPQEQATEGESQSAQNEQESTEGKVLSGGRWLDPSKPMIALTFDDGPYAPVGNRIMDVLEQYNGRSTFFVVGNRVGSYKTEILRMQQEGHEVANHTYEHKYLTKLGASAIRSQIEKCNAAVAAVTGVSPSLVRLPGGLKNGTVLSNVQDPIIMWNVDTQDWKTRNAQSTIDAVVGKIQDGDVVLMHELYSATGDAVAVIVPALAEQGYQFVTVSELASFRGGVAAGGIYSKFRP